MPRGRQGSIIERNDKIYARVTYTDPTSGKRRELLRRATNEKDAKRIIKQLLAEIDKNGVAEFSREQDATRLTFNDLADYYETNVLTPPVYISGRKVAGLRTYQEQQRGLLILRDYFGGIRLADITYDRIAAFRLKRLNTPTHRNKQRSLANVHRALALLRAMLRTAERLQWIRRSCFSAGVRPLISQADEVRRERILSFVEEKKLLDACCTTSRIRLRAILICALDTGMRRGEMLKLQWSAVDFASRIIRVEAFNTKTMRGRIVPISERLQDELIKLRATFGNNGDDALVFRIRDHIWGSLQNALREAEIEDFRLHDARHTFATRMIQGGMPIAEVARLLGHTTLAMTYRYTNLEAAAVKRAADILDTIHVSQQPQRQAILVDIEGNEGGFIN